MDSFDNNKAKIIRQISSGRKDKSLVGFVDEEAIPIVNLINSLQNFYTTSSCSGRVLLQTNPGVPDKRLSNRVYVSHKKVSKAQIMKVLNENETDGEIWFIFNSFILHVCARSIEDADKFLVAAKRAGLKRAGIFQLRKRIMLEIIGTQYMAAPIVRGKELVVSEQYVGELVDIANEKMKKNWDKLEKFNEEIKSLFFE